MLSYRELSVLKGGHLRCFAGWSLTVPALRNVFSLSLLPASQWLIVMLLPLHLVAVEINVEYIEKRLSWAMIETKDIHKYYGTGKTRHEALKGISLAFRENEFVAILGPSGSGKTTLLNVIGGLDHYDEGDLIINNISTKGYSARDWDSYRNHSIGFIFQSYNLIQHQTILANVEMSLTISGMAGAERKKLAALALERVGLGNQLNKRPNQLSGGQMQRVAIARALVNDPSVVLADEPTGALDSKTSVQVMELLKEVAQDRLIIMVTHNPELAEQYATRIITLKDGEIVSDTDPYVPAEEPETAICQNMGHSSMNVWTALSLSFHNLWTKRSRTILTAFAGSIGIIGIALIAALSSGVNDYIYRQEANMAYQYPLLVETLNMDVSTVLSDLSSENVEENSEQVAVIGFLEKLFAVLDINDLEALKEYLDKEENDIDQYGTVEYVYDIQPQIYVEYGESVKRVCPDATLDSLGVPVSSIDTSLISSSISTNMFYCMPQAQELYLDRYDVKAGRWPQDSSECILVLTSEGKISDYLLYVLGLRNPSEVDGLITEFIGGSKVETESVEGLRFAYEEFLGIQFKVVRSSDYYIYDEKYDVWLDRSEEKAYLHELVKNGQPLTIVGVVQPKKEYGTGVLKAGIDYPFDLLKKTVADAADCEIVTAQLAEPEVDIFTGTPFREAGAAKELDPASLIDVDMDMLKAAVQIDEEALQTYFLEGADLSTIQITIPDIDMVGLLEPDQLINRVLNQARTDLPDLLKETEGTSEKFSGMVQDILSDYVVYLSEIGYPNVGELTEMVRGYFDSQVFSNLGRDWFDTLEWTKQEEGYWNGKINELYDLILKSLGRYLTEKGVPSLPTVQNLLRDYLETERWRPFVQNTLTELLVDDSWKTELTAYLEQRLQPLVKAEIASVTEKVVAQVEPSITAQVQDAIEGSITRGLTAVVPHAMDCVYLDKERFIGAFSMKLGTEELSDILLSMTNFSKTTLSGNLKKLGYVDASRPKSIRIYPHDFEDKDAVIDVLDRFNQEMEFLDRQSDAISYTDTLGTVMSTLTRIITIITSALIATVAVSLVVSSIMIGVITYISVLERRKEIGILRAMGASKHNISQIFNAETFITGLLSGVMGVTLAYLLVFPLNAFLHSQTQIYDINAFLPFKYALLLVIISVVLTTIGGIIPAHNASKSDPVEALRTE